MRTYWKLNLAGEHGQALISVMIVIFVIAICLGAMVFASTQRAHMALKLGDRIRAHYIAEAGANHAYSIVKTNWAARTNSAVFPLSANYGEGSYISYVWAPNATSMAAAIICTGVCRSATAAVALDVRNSGTGDPGWDAHAFDYAILCGGTFDFGGCGNISSTNASAKLHSNSDITVSGDASVGGDVTKLDLESSTHILVKNNNEVKGDVAAPSLNIKGTVDGTATVTNVPTITIPNINLDPYYRWALEHGEVKPAGWKPSGPYTPNGGIVWVSGDTGTISQGPINGAIIAFGAIHISGQVNVNGGTNAFGFALVSGTGDIDNQSSGTIAGLLYAKTGNYKQTANGTLIGSLIVAGSISKGGCSDIIVYRRLVPTDPYAGTSTNNIGIAAWSL
jgi:cytoskeletal protein CcmA (bactofilin family)